MALCRVLFKALVGTGIGGVTVPLLLKPMMNYSQEYLKTHEIFAGITIVTLSIGGGIGLVRGLTWGIYDECFAAPRQEELPRLADHREAFFPAAGRDPDVQLDVQQDVEGLANAGYRV